jgi:hypothetical protein
LLSPTLPFGTRSDSTEESRHLYLPGSQSTLSRINAAYQFSASEEAWEAKLNLVTDIKRYHGPLDYLTDSDFFSEVATAVQMSQFVRRVYSRSCMSAFLFISLFSAFLFSAKLTAQFTSALRLGIKFKMCDQLGSRET